jgi:fructose-1,6-bisphosphatase/inositol monophosphatase family enzyme
VRRPASRWLVDPLCGTLNYAAGTPLAAVNVALETPAGVTAAVSADPIAGEFFWTAGTAASLRRGHVDTPLVPTGRSALVDIDCDGDFLGPALVADPEFRALFGARVVSTTLALAWVGAGRWAAYVSGGRMDGNVHFAAGIAVCRAAGCVVTDLSGASVRGGRGLIAAADAATHAHLLEIVGRHLGSPSSGGGPLADRGSAG